jgi:predicted GIY-YIG superfamily endonuclease
MYDKRNYYGVTNNMQRRQQQHDKGKTATTKSYNKNYKLIKIIYTRISERSYERKFKRIPLEKKMKMMSSWALWSGY